MRNVYYNLLEKIMTEGKMQANKKGSIKYLTNQALQLEPVDLLDIFETHGIARKKLKSELTLFMAGVRSTEQYRAEGITWWDYCGPVLINSYPTYFEKLPALIRKINEEKPTQKQTKRRVCRWCSFKLRTNRLCYRLISAVPMLI